MSQTGGQIDRPQPDPWLPAVSLVVAASMMKAVASRIGDGRVGPAMARAAAAVLKENGFPNPEDPEEPDGPGAPVQRFETAAALLRAAAPLPPGQVRKDLVGTAKHLVGGG